LALTKIPAMVKEDWSNIKEEEALERYKLITGNVVML
jgi:hypothetical protein